jgi:hypothetical protein
LESFRSVGTKMLHPGCALAQMKCGLLHFARCATCNLSIGQINCRLLSLGYSSLSAFDVLAICRKGRVRLGISYHLAPACR